MTQKSRKNLEISCFEVLVVFLELNSSLVTWTSFMEAYKIVVFDPKIFFSALHFFQFLVIKTMDPDWIRIRISIDKKMLDPAPYLDPHKQKKLDSAPYPDPHLQKMLDSAPYPDPH
jgi:hypothetical protein